MTTKTDITIELPHEFRSANSVPVERATIKRDRMIEILCAAVEADRQHAMPSGDDIAAACKSLGWDLDAQEEADMILLVQTVLARPTSGQPAASAVKLGPQEHQSPEKFRMRPAASVEPSGYAYRYPDGGIRFTDGRKINGCHPTESIPYWFGAAPVAAQAPAVAWMDDGSTTRGPGKPAYRVVTAATKAEMPAIVAAAYSTPLGVIGAAQPCDHVYEARPIDGSRSAAAPSEAVCRKCGARGGVSLTPDMQRGEKRGAESGQDHDTALADAERRGYARAEAENVGYRTDAGRYRFIRPGDKEVWCSSGDDFLTGDRLDAAIDAARVAKGADHG